ncbi:MAG: hypothetical protein NTZ65_04185 [Candidatus Berkelbacteria bacterium]|nr:hypothetical protein [Candidatus Berkelbacteria bacterium]
MTQREKLPAILVTKEALDRDPALQPGGRGLRRICSIEPPREEEEREADEVGWQAGDELVQVHTTENWELSCFREFAHQHQHRHMIGTEIYTVLKGMLKIAVNSVSHEIEAPGFIAILPGTMHEVYGQDECLVQVTSINCQGAEDKWIVE